MNADQFVNIVPLRRLEGRGGAGRGVAGQGVALKVRELILSHRPAGGQPNLLAPSRVGRVATTAPPGGFRNITLSLKRTATRKQNPDCGAAQRSNPGYKQRKI